MSVSSVLAPPYDVIDDRLRAELYGRDRHNIVRIDAGEELPGDRPGAADRYTRAQKELSDWLAQKVLVPESSPSFYVADHRFRMPDGTRGHRRGLFATIPATDWPAAPIRPHERTLRGPKEDRLALMRATRMNTSAVFGVWTNADGMAEALAMTACGPPVLEARLPGENGEEEVQLWVGDRPDQIRSIEDAGAAAALYIADGHHRYETAAAYARERRAQEPSAPQGAAFGHTLAYLCAADDPSLLLLPTHRMILPRAGLPGTLAEVIASVEPRFSASQMPGLEQSARQAQSRRAHDHAFTVLTRDGVLLITRPRSPDDGVSPRDHLDVTVLERELLGPWGIGADDLTGGALSYDHNADTVATAVAGGSATVGILLNGARVEEMLAVADAGDTMPQKSTYFQPKVPTGLVMSPL